MLHVDSVAEVAFSPDGHTLVTLCDDGSARLWDASTGKPIGAALPHSALAVAFHPDGQVVLTGGRQGTAQFWTVPRPLSGDANQVLLWTKIVTAADVDDNGVLHMLDPESVRELHRQWERKGAVPAL
jgi:eukaryotic-like serine/threonine-protein kinase